MTFDDFIKEWRSSSSYIVAHTSGSTGAPKEIKLEKEFVRESAFRTNSFFNISESSRLHSCVSPDFIGGKMMAVRAEISGGRLIWETPSNEPLKEMRKNEIIDLLAVVPSQMLHILNNPDKMPLLRAVIIGGSSINPDLREKIAEAGINAYETYGMTETASHIALRKVEKNEGHFHTLPGICVGLDGRGCLEIYFKSGETVTTNDLATVYGDVEFEIVGRYDHVIITGGRKVNPYDVEKKIAHLINGTFVISSLPDEKWGSRVILKLEGGDNLDDHELIEKLRPLVNPWELPKEVLRVDCIERTKNGKIKR